MQPKLCILPHAARSHPCRQTSEQRQHARELFEQSQGRVMIHPTQWNPPETPIPPIPGVEVLDAYRCGVAHCPLRFVPAGQESKQQARTTAWREHQRVQHGSSEFGDRGRPPVASAMVARADAVNAGDSDGAGDAWGSLRQVQRLFYNKGPYHEVCLATLETQETVPEPPAAEWVQTVDAAADFRRFFANLQQEQAHENRARARP